MLISIPSDTTLWESVAALQIVQALDKQIKSVSTVGSSNADIVELFRLGGVQTLTLGQYMEKPKELDFAKAYRMVEESKLPYATVLERTNGLSGIGLDLPKFPRIKPGESAGIIVAPFPVKSELGIPHSIWKAVTSLLRTYGKTVYQIGETGQRQEGCAYTENEILSEQSVERRLTMLASAELIVGVPNAWTWAATSWNKRMCIMYPDDISIDRWFPYHHPDFGIMLYQRTRLQTPVILTALRQIISKL